MPKDASRNAWENRTRDVFDRRSGGRVISTTHFLNRPEARIMVYGGGLGLRVETSLPKLVHGDNLSALVKADGALKKLRDFTAEYVAGDLPDFGKMEFLRVDYCHNFRVGERLIPDYIATLSRVNALKHRATTDGFDGVEWWNSNGRKIRAYDKHHEILEKNKTDLPEARGVLRFEVQIRKRSGYLQRRTGEKHLTLAEVLQPPRAYVTLAETLNRMCLDCRFVPQDRALTLLEEKQFSRSKTCRLLGVLQFLETRPINDLRRSGARSTFFRDKLELRSLGLWPPAVSTHELPGLFLPPLEELVA